MAMTTMGTVAPATGLGSLVQGDAEVVSGMVMAQLAAPGAPVFHSILVSMVDPYTGGYVSEVPLPVASMAVELAHAWGVPSISGGGLDTDDAGMGFHAVVPDFRDLRGIEDDVDRALGIYNLRAMPCRTVLENVERSVRVDGDRTFVHYRTPVGTVSTTVLYDEAMRRAGASLTHVESYAFKNADDYDAVGFIFENARVEPNYGGYQEFADRIGERGIAVAAGHHDFYHRV